MLFDPLVSIVIPVYNGSNYIREAIDSALTQTYAKIEVIVVNDGSSDNTEEIVLAYGDKIRYFKKENRGQSTALNMGIENMKGEYFSWLSHDDIYFPEKIEKQLLFLSRLSQPARYIPYSDYQIIDNKSNHISIVRIPEHSYDSFRYEMLVSSPINGCTALVPKKAFDLVGLFNVSRPHTSDVEFFFDAAEKYRFVHMPEVLIKSRVHGKQMTHIKSAYHNFESNLFLKDSLMKMSLDEISKLGGISSTYETLVLNWASRGYRNAYKYALSEYKKHKSNYFSFYKVILKSYLAYYRKHIKIKLKYLIYRFKKW